MPIMNGFEVVDTWLTPTVLFCILNLTIVTIFLLKPHEKLKKLVDIDQFTPVVRIRPFLFESIQSINPATYLRDPQFNPDHLIRPVNSLLELVKPIKLVTLFGSKSQPDPVHQEPAHVVAKTRSEITVRKAMKNNLITSYYHEESVSVTNNKVLVKSVSDASPVKNYLPEFVRVKSLLEPIKITLFGSDPKPDSKPDPPTTQDPAGQHTEPGHARDTEKKSHVRSRSDMVRMKHVRKVLRKSVSAVNSVAEVVEEETEERRPETVREKKKSLGDEAVDAKADDFISRFRKQLKLQRMAPHFEMHGNVEQRDWEVSGGVELLG